LHTTTDAFSPEHQGFQVWHGIGWTQPINDIRAAWHVTTEFISGHTPFGAGEAGKEEAEYAARVLWAQYQLMLEAARKKAEADKKKSRCKENPGGSDC